MACSGSLPLILVASLLALTAADQNSLECPVRQIGLDYAQSLQPWRTHADFQAVADALNGAVEVSPNCNVQPRQQQARGSHEPATRNHVIVFPLPNTTTTAATGTTGPVVFVDPSPLRGSDSTGKGNEQFPFRSLQRAVESIREARAAAGVAARHAAQATVVLREGTFHLGSVGPLMLTAADSRITFQAYPGEVVFISGGETLDNLNWQPTQAPSRPAYEYHAGSLEDGFDIHPAGQYTVQSAQDLCTSLPLCAGFSFAGSSPNPSGPVQVSFKYALFYVPQRSSVNQGVYVKNLGYLAGQKPALYKTSVDADVVDIDGLRVGGVRMIRARYPNVGTVEQIGAMQLVANSWTKQPMGTNANYTFNPSSPSRDDSAGGYFQTFKIGVGGPCSFRFTPQSSYWCSSNSQGGGPGPYQAPVGMQVTNISSSLPHTPYTSPVSRAVVHSWRAGRWFSWAFAVDSQTFDPATGATVFNFSLTKGGNQGSRGGDAGQEFFIENVLDELDAPAEFYFDPATKQLYLWFNTTDGSAPAPGSVVAAKLPVIINATGTQAEPVVDVGFLGIGFRDSAPFFLGPHGTPSGGDWAVERSGALFFEGTENTLLDGCYLTTLDGNGVFFSGYTRGANVTRSEFVSIGETAISQWGYTDGSPVPGMGFDATKGNQPRGTSVTYNLVHEVGLWTKQNSFYFQSESFGNTIEGNIAYNGPRAGVNFDDGMGGGSLLTRNVLFNFCRESSDHGPFNSWNRQVYLVDGPDGQPTSAKLNDTISYNWILANYHSSMAIDNDDGSAYYDTHHNVFINAAEGAAYGGSSLKSDFGGHDNYHHDNLDLFWNAGFGIDGVVDGHADGYYNNILWIANDGDYGHGQVCTGGGATHVFNNTVYTPHGKVTECGMSLEAWQAKGGDPLTKALTYPADDVILGIARGLLGL